MSHLDWDRLDDNWPIWLALLGIVQYLLAIVVLYAWILWNRVSDKLAGRDSDMVTGTDRATGADSANSDLPGVTVLKPISGVDEELRANIESFFTLDYPKLQLLFAGDRLDDPGIEVVREVAAKFPERDFQLVHSVPANYANLKVVNLENMLPLARHPLVLLSDSNVRLQSQDLRELVRPMRDPRCGLVYQAVVGVGEESHSAFVENARLTEFAGVLTVVANALFLQDIVMGKGMLCRRAALQDAGDFVSVRNVAADDHLLAMEIKRAGWKLRLGSVPAYVFHSHWTWRSCYSRHLRHAALRWRVCWPAYPLEIWFSPIVCALPALLLCGVLGFITWLAVVVIKLVAELAGLFLLRGALPPGRFIPSILVKDALFLLIWIHALFVRHVSWRGIPYRITSGSRLIPLRHSNA